MTDRQKTLVLLGILMLSAMIKNSIKCTKPPLGLEKNDGLPEMFADFFLERISRWNLRYDISRLPKYRILFASIF